MALIKCRFCNSTYSDLDPKCPHCDGQGVEEYQKEPMDEKTALLFTCGGFSGGCIIVLVVIIILLITFIFSIFEVIADIFNAFSG